MKRIKITGLVLISILTGATVFAQSELNQQITVPLSNPGKAYSLNASSYRGSIKVTGYTGKDILIDVTVETPKEKNRSKDSVNGMHRISGAGNYEVNASEKNNVVTINAGLSNRTINLDIKIPQNVKLKLNSTTRGEIEVNNVTGEIEINTLNGEIKMMNISGSVVASTLNGQIMASFNAVDPKAPMAFSTLNGKINISFPGDTKANFKIKSDRGEVYADFPMDIDKTEAKMSKDENQNMYKLKMESWINGKINGGGPEILIKNMNGNIYVHKTK